jgi:glycosyltransferase involved in cell wall biosynthesis
MEFPLNNMKIGIDGNEANVENRVGVNMYAFELLWSLYKIQDDQTMVTIYLKNTPREDLPPQRDNWKYKVLSGRGVWIITRLMPHLFLTKNKSDVFFTPSHYIPPFAPMPRVCSIMDLGYLDFSGHLKKYDYWQLRLWSAYSIYVAKCIFSISDATKKDIVRHYNTKGDKIVVTPLAYDTSKFYPGLSISKCQEVKTKYGIKGEYVLFISTLKPSKNIEGLVSAWEEVKKRFPHTRLVIAGKKGWMYEDIFRKVRAKSLEKDIIFTDFVAEVDKPYLI